MTEIEVKQACANMSRQQLLNLFTTIEGATWRTFTCAEKVYDVREAKKKAEEEVAYAKNYKKVGLILTIVFAAVAVFFFIVSGNVGKFSGFFCKLFGFGGLGLAIIALVSRFTQMSSGKKAEKQLEELIPQEAAAVEELERVKAECATDIILRQWLCPAECAVPQYLRIFVSYFENGRADSMKEALGLFEEHMHRERMETAANQQLQAALAAQAAANAAAAAANNAAATAAQAKNSADWAAYQARYVNK